MNYYKIKANLLLIITCASICQTFLHAAPVHFISVTGAQYRPQDPNDLFSPGFAKIDAALKNSTELLLFYKKKQKSQFF